MKGQGMSINILIIAVIGLVVMVIVLALFAGQTSKSKEALSSCGAAGGICVQSGENPPSGAVFAFGKSCGEKDLGKDNELLRESEGFKGATDKIKETFFSGYKCYIT